MERSPVYPSLSFLFFIFFFLKKFLFGAFSIFGPTGKAEFLLTQQYADELKKKKKYFPIVHILQSALQSRASSVG